MFKEAPEIIYTGLAKTIGSPKELEKNTEEPTNFSAEIDISIPIEETLEYAKSH